LARHLPNRQVRAFGSRATGRAWCYSDLDLLVMGSVPIPDLTLASLRADFEDSDLPFRVDVLEERDLPAFFDFPADHWVHLRTTNPIESTFATVRHRTRQTKNCVTRATFLGLAFKLSQEAAKSWRRIRAPEKVANLLDGTRYKDGIPVPDDPPESAETEQREAA
jgi:predicted nucleotidyltransferase